MIIKNLNRFKISYLIGICVIITGIFSACTLFTEESIENETVYLLSPVDSLNTFSQTHTFWWDNVPNVTGYSLQIVRPTFDSVVELVLDSNLTTNKFTLTLNPGGYQWGVSAYNGTSSTPYFIRDLIIDTTSNLNNQTITLKSPVDGYATNNKKVTLSWNSLFNATSYIVEIRDSNSSGENIINPVITTDLSLEVTLEEKVYAWGVQARNDNSASLFSYRTIVIDTTAPGKPRILRPSLATDSLNTEPYQIEWSHPNQSLSAIYDSVIISSDSLLTTIQDVSVIQNGNTNYSVTGLENGWWYYRIRSFDKAGNIGESTAIRKFYLEQE